MEDKNMEIQLVDRAEVLNKIEEYGETHAADRKTSPAWTAAQIMTSVKRLEPKAVGRGTVLLGEIERDFVGMNLSYGKCEICGEKLIWYTRKPIKGCPYCFARRPLKKKGDDRDGNMQ